MKKLIVLFFVYNLCAITLIQSASIASSKTDDEKIPVEVVYLKQLREPEDDDKPQGKQFEY